MRTVTQAADLPGSLRAARSEALSSFGDPAIYVERRIIRPRHIEIQVLGDREGNVVHLFERDCSIQQRHQKVVEETPCPAIDESGEFFFLEMNTRLQVEHPITELVTSTDLVHWQIRIARGERLDLDHERMLAPVGHAIECRIYAEDPDRDFLPSPGLVTALRAPAGPGIRRDDGGAVAGVVVPVFYDPLIAKLATWAETRPMAIARMARALDEYDVRGIKTTIPFFRWLLADPDFLAGRIDTTFIDHALAARNGRPFLEVPEDAEHIAAVAAALQAFTRKAPAAPGLAASDSRWQRAARTEALR
jgi:acetyl-CoA carboxylase biotin carboxylase subunit